MQIPMANSPLLPDHTRDSKQPEVCDDHFAVIIKDILGLEVFVHDALGMKIPHALQDSQPCIRGWGMLSFTGVRRITHPLTQSSHRQQEEDTILTSQMKQLRPREDK